MRSINPVLSLVLAVLGLAIFSASATAATPPSPYDAGQPGLVADDWTPFVDAARAGDPLPEALAPGDDGMTAGGTGGICPTADACWIDGVGTYQTFPNCIIGGTGYVYTYVGYWGKDDFSYPQTGDRYWGHLVSGVVGSACGGEYIGTDIELPAATQFDLDGTPEGKIRCFYTSGKTGNTEEITNHSQADCRQNPGAGRVRGMGPRWPHHPGLRHVRGDLPDPLDPAEPGNEQAPGGPRYRALLPEDGVPGGDGRRDGRRSRSGP